MKTEPSRPLQYMKAIAQSNLPTGTRATCWAIASFADNTSGKAYPSVRALAKATGLSGPIVSQHTARAEAAGFLHKERRLNNSIVYTITTPISDNAHGVAVPLPPPSPLSLAGNDGCSSGLTAWPQWPSGNYDLPADSAGRYEQKSGVGAGQNPCPNYLKVLPQ